MARRLDRRSDAAAQNAAAAAATVEMILAVVWHGTLLTTELDVLRCCAAKVGACKQRFRHYVSLWLQLARIR